jgi:hypothetical protein
MEKQVLNVQQHQEPYQGGKQGHEVEREGSQQEGGSHPGGNCTQQPSKGGCLAGVSGLFQPEACCLLPII